MRDIKISTADCRTARLWNNQGVSWIDFTKTLAQPHRSPETYAEYITYSKDIQARLKDVGGFVGGWFSGGVRKNKNLTLRSLVTLDLDNIPTGELMDVVAKVRSLEYTYCMYSTRKHSEGSPRIRVIFPLDRDCTPEEYEPLARKLGELIGINRCDPTTFQPSRLMYYPSVCSDAQYFYGTGEGNGLVPVDRLLAIYNDWKDVSEWAVPFGSPQVVIRSVDNRQSNPREKKGVVGAFCKLYSVEMAIDEFIPDKYIPVDDGPGGRYTYTDGSTTGGAIVFDDGDFLYSYHATDPAGGGLRNAFDLVRLHKFGHLDVGHDTTLSNGINSAERYTSPSNTAMRDFAKSIKPVQDLLAEERLLEAHADFAGNDEELKKFVAGIKYDKKGKIVKDSANILYILRNDPILKDTFKFDIVANQKMVLRKPPWHTAGEFQPRVFSDFDIAGINMHLLTYGIKDRKSVDEALNVYWLNAQYNPLAEYLDSLVWDGVERAKRLFVYYLGAEDTKYNHRATIMWLVGCVRRALNPGCKFDLMVTLIGSQGAGKSEFISKLSAGWGLEDLSSFTGKESIEQIQGAWLVEISELEAMTRTSIEKVKNFISRKTDRIRFAYARETGNYPRTCAFIGTTNEHDMLSDMTGNRRHLPITVWVNKPLKDPYKVKLEVNQIWAEVMALYRAGEPSHYDHNDPDYALLVGKQEEHTQEDFYAPMIVEFLSRQVLPEWNRLGLSERLVFWNTPTPTGTVLVDRDRVCAQEIWFELLGGSMDRADERTIRKINKILAAQKGWKRQTILVDYVGRAKGFIKI